MDIRERIAKSLDEFIWEQGKKQQDTLDKILSDPDIKKGLELLELYKAEKIVKLAGDQTLPIYPSYIIDTTENKWKSTLMLKVQTDMLKDGWVKADRELK